LVPIICEGVSSTLTIPLRIACVLPLTITISSTPSLSAWRMIWWTAWIM
jgi:hypothetical protein